MTSPLESEAKRVAKKFYLKDRGGRTLQDDVDRLAEHFIFFAHKAREEALRECADEFNCVDIYDWKPKEIVRIILSKIKK